MKKACSLLSLIALVVLISSCVKCDASKIYDSGYIIDGSRVRAMNNAKGPLFINDQPSGAPLEMSLDGGETYFPIDFGKYSVFALPTSIQCSYAGIRRDVTVVPNEQKVTYTVTITECNDCDYGVHLNNWVVTEKVPSTYTFYFNEIRK